MVSRLTFLFLAACVCLAGMRPQCADAQEIKRVALLPFENISGEYGFKDLVMPHVKDILEEKGYRVVYGEEVEESLYRDRIRRTGAISKRNAGVLKERLNVDYVMVGTFYLFAFVRDNPQFGLSARIISPDDGSILWTETAGATGEDYTKILGFGTVRTTEDLVPKVVDKLFKDFPDFDEDFDIPSRSSLGSIFSIFGGDSESFVSEQYKSSPPVRVAILPFENLTERMGAAKIVTDVFLSEMFKSGRFELVELGEVEEASIEHDVWPYGGITDDGVERLRAPLGVDALILGTVEVYDEGLKRHATVPEIALYARMVSAREDSENRILWTCHVQKNGKQTQIVLDFGIVKSMVPLTSNAIIDMIDTL